MGKVTKQATKGEWEIRQSASARPREVPFQDGMDCS
jgi:hypothetical protein